MNKKFLLILTILVLFPAFITIALADESLNGADSWTYQLQNISIKDLYDSEYDIVVIDYSKDGSDREAFSKEEIQKLKDSGKIVLAYFSIGEAEKYRYYWDNLIKNNPKIIGHENPEWSENFKVKYWKKEWWQQYLKPYLDKIITAGFDGVYLDIIDAYWFWHEKENYSLEFTANEMVSLVKKIGDYSKSKNSSFIICPQNGESIIDDASQEYRKKYFNSIDAIGVEDLFYNFGDKNDQKYRLKLLKEYINRGKIILNVEYIPDGKLNDYKKQYSSAGYKIIPFAASVDRKLDRLK